jgi:hypothetical protein
LTSLLDNEQILMNSGPKTAVFRDMTPCSSRRTDVSEEHRFHLKVKTVDEPLQEALFDVSREAHPH